MEQHSQEKKATDKLEYFVVTFPVPMLVPLHQQTSATRKCDRDISGHNFFSLYRLFLSFSETSSVL